jgi:colanic acid/amylovoran biosynthesis glycosyltransferase
MAVKTLHLFENYLPNAQNWAFRILNNLPASEVNIAAYRYYNPQFVTENIKLVPLPSFVNPQLLEGKDSAKNLLSKIFNRIKNQQKNAQLFDYLARWCNEQKIELLHAHFANMGWHYLKLKELTGLPFVVSFYGFDYENLPFSFPVWKKRYQTLFKTVDYFICEGPFGASILMKQGCAEEKIFVVPLGVETAKIPEKKRNKTSNQLHLLQVANYAEKKGHIYSIRAFIEAEKSCPNMTLTLVGHDMDVDHLRLVELVQEAGLQNKVTFMDFIDFSKVYDFFADYHVFIHPSCYAANRDCEGGAPIVILDAEATGMPVISTTHCDIPSEVIHQKTGLLSPEKDVSSLAESIRYFYSMDNDSYQKYASEARNHVLTNFNIKHCAHLLQLAYNKMVQA